MENADDSGTLGGVDETGHLIPARVQGVAADGKFYAPLDAYSRIGVQGQHFFHTNGESTLWAPEGVLKLTAIRGFEHWPAQAEVVVGKKPASVKIDSEALCGSAT